MASLFRSTFVRQAVRACARPSVLAVRGVTQTQSMLRVRTPLNPVGSRYFSAEDLSALLAREHAEEIENDRNAVPADLADLKKTLEQEWKIMDDGAMTRLYKNMGAFKIQVSFHCQDNVSIEMESFMDDEEMEVDPEDGEPIRFTVTATKAGKSMVLTCLSEHATARIQSVSISSDPVDTIQTAGVAAKQYQGPEFIELAEDLQEAYHSYLEEIGINQDVATFVAMWADLKEQTEYVQFLEDSKTLVL